MFQKSRIETKKQASHLSTIYPKNQDPTETAQAK
jgi:hypothetical protein